MSVLHIPSFDISLIFVSKMGDSNVQTMFEKDACKMVQGVMVLMKGVRIGMLYKLLGRTNESSCLSIFDLKIDEISS